MDTLEECIGVSVRLEYQLGGPAESMQHRGKTWARDYKEISSMDWCSTHDFVLYKQKTQKW